MVEEIERRDGRAIDIVPWLHLEFDLLGVERGVEVSGKGKIGRCHCDYCRWSRGGFYQVFRSNDPLRV